jgi:hypothetical protein
MKISLRLSAVLTALAVSQLGPGAWAGVLTPPASVPSAADIDQSPDNLALKQTLDTQYQSVTQLYQLAEPGAESYVQQYAKKTVVDGSPEQAAGMAAYAQIRPSVDAYNTALADYSAKLAQLRMKPPAPPPVPSRLDMYVDPGSLLVQDDSKYQLAKIQAEIDGIKNALIQLNSVKDLNNAQLQEWQKASEKASDDAWELGANLTIDLLTENLTTRGSSIDQQIQQDTASMAGETDPAKLKSIQGAIDDLNAHKTQLEKAQEAVDAARTGADAFSKAVEGGDSAGTQDQLSQSQKVSQALEQGWAIASQEGILPQGADKAKTMVDAAYLVAVQCVSVGQINDIAADVDLNLKAVTALSQKMEALVDLKKATAAAIEASKLGNVTH